MRIEHLQTWGRIGVAAPGVQATRRGGQRPSEAAGAAIEARVPPRNPAAGKGTGLAIISTGKTPIEGRTA
jgi:hypothetical protein